MPLQIQRPLGVCLVQGCIQAGTDSTLTCRENPLAFRVGGDLGQVLFREDHHNTCECLLVEYLALCAPWGRTVF